MGGWGGALGRRRRLSRPEMVEEGRTSSGEIDFRRESRGGPESPSPPCPVAVRPVPMRWREGRTFLYGDGTARFIREGYYVDAEWKVMVSSEARRWEEGFCSPLPVSRAPPSLPRPRPGLRTLRRRR